VIFSLVLNKGFIFFLGILVI